jgi:hypothetical protein
MNRHAYGCSRFPRPCADMGEFADTEDFEIVAYLVVLPETAILH